MKITTRYALPSDTPTLAKINIDAFAGQGFITNAFPNIPYEAVHPLKCARYLQKMAHPLTHVISAVASDSDSDSESSIVGCARWVIPATGESAAKLMADAAAAETGAVALPEGTNREIYDGFFEALKVKAEPYLRDDDIVLEFLATLPAAQGNGVGQALLRWGMAQADKQQKRIYLEATTQGFPLYAKLGWRALDTVRIDYERWGGEGTQELTIMIHIPQAVECIQTVFADDPFFQYMFDQSTYNLARNAASLSAHFLHGLAINAPIYIAKQVRVQNTATTSPNPNSNPNSNRIVGICWWHPPTSKIPKTSTTANLLLSLRQLLANIRHAGRGGLHLHRYKQWKTLQAATHARLWTDARGYYFCNVIAVRAEMRGKGVGRRLVEVVTERADREGMPCYLESSKGMPNLVIYERLGFQGTGEIECVDGKDECLVSFISLPVCVDDANEV
ncbi:acyl-CoA N-acyltransferase [Aspergillus californicus]